MSFSSDFLAYFTDEEKESQIVRIYASQGDNADLALEQEAQKLIQSGTELLKFPESRLRSWLAALLQMVQNLVSAEGTMTVTNHGDDTVNLTSGLLVMTEPGTVYTQVSDDVMVIPGASVVVKIRQGEAAVTTGYYHEYIKVAGEDLDLKNIKVTLAGQNIQPCETSDGNVLPTNGYFAFYYDNQLFVKIFPGDNTPYPEGSYFRITAWKSDGKAGNISKDAVTGYADRVNQLNGLPANLTFSNPAITNGVDSPTRADLVNQLRYWFFVKDSVSSIPEYMHWLKNQPEVGDCIVEGDYERALRDPNGLEYITGAVYIAAINREGVPISAEDWNALYNRIQPYKDVAILYKAEPVATYCYLDIRFFSSSDNASFIDQVNNVVANYFSLAWLREQGYSIFDDLDFELVRKSIGNEYNQSGLEIIPYHVYPNYVVEVDGQAVNMYMPYVGESGNGYIEVWRNGEVVYTYVQQKQPSGEILIYDPASPGSEIIGYVDQAVLHITTSEEHPNNLRKDDIVKAFWEIENPGILPIGQSYGYRVLYDFKVRQIVEG